MEGLPRHERPTPNEVRNEVLRVLNDASIPQYSRENLLQILRRNLGPEEAGETTYDDVLDNLIKEGIVNVANGIFMLRSD